MKNVQNSDKLHPTASDALSKTLLGKFTKVAPKHGGRSDVSSFKRDSKDSETLHPVHSDILSKALMSKLTKVTPKQLEKDGIVMSADLVEDLPQVEIKYLLDNMIPPEELVKIAEIQSSMSSLTSYEEEFSCPYCKKLKRHPEEPCCESKEIQVYLSKCEDQKLMKRFSSYSFSNSSEDELQTSLENVKLIGEMHKTIQERKSKISLNKFMEIKKDKSNSQRNEQFKSTNFEKHKGTFLRIQKKLENIKKYCPEMYTTDESIIAMWAGAGSSSKDE